MCRVQQDSAQQSSWVERLCPQCGLCCNGVLFADVRLVRDDHSLATQTTGLALVERRGRLAFTQPCACFDGSLCLIYSQRPARCRGFDCYTLKQLERGKIGIRQAKRRVREVRMLADNVRRLLRRLGDHDESLALIRRYHRVMAQPVDLSDGGQESELRGKLMTGVGELMQRVHSDFLRPGSPAAPRSANIKGR